nr:E3 ubiquitin ligase BIG BROTHER-related [Tanacetum cinerariifolium]
DTWDDVDPDELSYEELIALGEVVGTESRGLSADSIASLRSIIYKTQNGQNGSNETCVICRLDYEDADNLILLSCKHSYHSECIANWLQINKVCPVCSTERNKADLEEQSLDDLFNNLKIYEAEVKGSSTSSQNIQNIAFVSSNNTDSTNESVNAAPSVSAASSKAKVSTLPNVDSLSDAVIYSFFESQSNSPQLDNKDLKQIDPDDLKEMDLKWECRSPRDNRNKETTRRTVLVDVSTSNALVSQCLESVKARLVVYQKNETAFEEDIKLLKLDVMLRDNALAELRKKLEKAEKERNDLKLTLDKFQNSSKNLKLHSQESDNRVTENLENDRYKIGEGYHVVFPPYTGNFLPPKLDLVFNDDTNASESGTNVINVESSEHKTSKDKSKTHRPDAPIIEDWLSDSEDETEIESMPQQREPIFVKCTEHVKISRESVKKVEHNKQAENLRTNNQKSRGGLTCLFAKATLDEYNLWHRRLGHINFKTMNKLVKEILQIQVSNGLGLQKKLSFLFDVQSNPQQDLHDKGVIDNGCSRHMTGNISFLSEFEEIDG